MTTKSKNTIWSMGIISIGLFALFTSGCGKNEFKQAESAQLSSQKAETVSLGDTINLSMDSNVRTAQCTGKDVGGGIVYQGSGLIHSFTAQSVGSITVNCEIMPYGETTFTQTASYSYEVVDSGMLGNQAPKIYLNIKDASGTRLAMITHAQSENIGQARFQSMQSLVFDFSKTQDDNDSASAISYEVSFTLDQTLTKKQGMNFNHAFSTAGIWNVIVKAVDSGGRSSSLNFLANIACEPGAPALRLSSAGISVTADPISGYFTYDASSAVQSGRGPFTYSWDMDGDDSLDKHLGLIFFPEVSFRDYSAFSGMRKVSVQITDACSNTKTVSVNTNLDTLLAPGDLGVLNSEYHYIQAELDDGSTDKRKNGQFIVSAHSSETPSTRRVDCSYKNSGGLATATIETHAWHDAKVGDADGMTLEINNITDDGSNGTFNGGSVKTLTYTTDNTDDDDGINNFSDRGCTLNNQVIRQPVAGKPCSSAPGGMVAGTRVEWIGTFSCPNSRENISNSPLDITNGYYRCERTFYDACGGGGGGGGVTPVPR